MTWKVKTFLAKKKLRLCDIAEITGKSEALISQILSGNHKGYRLRPKIAALLGISPATLAREIDTQKPVNKSIPTRRAA